MYTGGFFRVFHVKIFDEATSCSCLSQCLKLISDWSNQNPGHTPGVIHIEPRGFNYNNNFCDEFRGAQAMRTMRTEILETLGQDKIYFPEQLLRGCPVLEHTSLCMAREPQESMLAALQRHGWPKVSDLSGKFILSMNLFGSAHQTPPDGNEDCRRYYYAMGQEESSKIMPFGGMPLFTRGDLSGAKGPQASNYTAFCEKEGTEAQQVGWMGMIMRWAFLRAPDRANTILDRFANFPSQLVSYHEWKAV